MKKILAIETSCDETSAAVVEDGVKILSNIVATQTEFHQKYGGIVPEIAARKHIELINPIIQEALDKAKINFKDLDAVAVTYGPGLIGSLIVGLCAAKAIAWAQKIPLIGINHLEGHIYANLLISPLAGRAGKLQPPSSNLFPFMCLLVSGGHTMIVHVKNHGKYETLGRTRDDAAGEAFDKAARVLGLSYPGGPLIDKLAKEGDPYAIPFKHPMIEKEYAYDFSFSGIKTAVVNYVDRGKGQGARGKQQAADIAASFQKVVVETLVEKLIKAAKDKNVKTVSIAGGVSANSELRGYLQKRVKEENLIAIIPPLEYCTDNAAMIGCAAFFKFKRGEFSSLSLKPSASLKL
ncbi:tRNA (adenosine(37)-N6)-threonylcarbamoyltransferase complex transferase subunit TsaD [candidate division WOR-1 bacterium RIFOXYD2_FULL_36_8]|uniref:tRNA N6-adenosine threonylcarbamoyltransferase n=1 Tax=candidate division WOR-1 bacterium RIFOXYB2_FULL_36_35 TaxID=1802578 RepID=A0A1F4S0M3_UNCSA|nr:MAG: tRNA (adenosine(37)-N6)-threonylcarbamoyltransferase complex transferase subunit TsaD [candidate division WOR-1 bacterium RIFOXYA2_FULL_36_21]OGC13978.1 MAG: tRNA (adenosine(37)-N6)-threonylcarbamoyltransferase complex transferase subunit TsaD [candidate division WOR-1 bacterium RIFOXYB2_FULL_36_35]OGC41213.1 MAG: tRNA (adenosine(37)-N6)-threonylcarbamoyltransferase complex transferase subunit TsaD [candidate division WOR-1 bacterium RIFOXYD2_FULL_36_8]